MEWSKRVINDVLCLTVREIAATIRSFAEYEDIYETIMTIYGARYQDAKREELRKLFLSYPTFKDFGPKQFIYPKEFPECFRNNSLSRALKNVFFSFKNKRHVILSSDYGAGVTQIAKWISQYFNKINDSENDSCNQEFFCVCSEETKCEDLFGKQEISYTRNKPLKWKSGFLTKAIKKGGVAVLDSINEVPTTVTERLKELLNQNYDDKIKYIEVPENLKKKQVKINENFRLLCTCKIDKINQMSPAFLNRFDVIVLENQLKDVSPTNLKELIKFLLQTTNLEKQRKNQLDTSDYDDDDDFIFFSDDEWGEVEIENLVVIQEQFNPTADQINLVFNNIQTSMTMSQIAQLCHAVAKYIKFFNGDFEEKLIVHFAKDMLEMNKDFSFEGKYEKLQAFLLSHLQPNETNDDEEFFYKDSPQLCEFIAKLFAASLINLPICIHGPTGIGKTLAAKAFARMRPCTSRSKYQIHFFHSGTKPNHLYGKTSLIEKKIQFIIGPLTTALIHGDTFIAEEMNLSSPSTMKALSAALEPCNVQTIYIPGAGNFEINPEFFFIACQNELGIIGRNEIPASISSRFRFIEYPKLDVYNISSICLDISQNFYKIGEEVPSFTKEEAMKVGEYMISLNNLQQHILPKWSLRDVTKLFRRIHYQDVKCANRIINVNIYHNILFYTMSPVNKNDEEEILPIVIDLIGNTFGLTRIKRQKLQECIEDQPKINKQKQGTYIMKGECGILYDDLSDTTFEFKNPSLLHEIFMASLSDEEFILSVGQSGFKTFLSKYFLPSETSSKFQKNSK